MALPILDVMALTSGCKSSKHNECCDVPTDICHMYKQFVQLVAKGLYIVAKPTEVFGCPAFKWLNQLNTLDKPHSPTASRCITHQSDQTQILKFPME